MNNGKIFAHLKGKVNLGTNRNQITTKTNLSVLSGNQGETSDNNLNVRDVVEDVEQSREFAFLPHIYTTMVQHCIGQKPIEACGLLSGKDAVANTLWPMTNILFSPNSFEMDNHQIAQVFRQIQNKGERLVGIYHSHPTSPAYPSLIDIIHANYPEVIYVIVSLSNIKPDVGCFKIKNRQVTPVKYMIQSK